MELGAKMLDIDLVQLSITLVVFIVLIGLLNSWLYNPLLGYMGKRDSDIQKDLNEAGHNSSDVNTLYAEAEKIISDAKAQAAQIRTKAVNDAKELAQSRADEKREQMQGVYEEFQGKLEVEKENLKNSLLSQMPLFKEALKAKFAKV